MAADVTITDAKIAGGQLVITGTASPNTWVRLDERKGADFNVKSGPSGAFSFGVVYHPGDCIVELQKLISPTSLGAATAALVANCGPVGITPRGAWNAKAGYSANDLVTFDGSSWRAKSDNAGREPGAAAVWELFAAKGDAADGAGDESQTADGEAAAARRVPPTGPAGGDLSGTYPNPLIRVGAVTSNKIANTAITTVKLAALAVTTIKITNFAVTTAKIANAAVTTIKLANLAVTTVKIADLAVTTDKIAQDAIVTSRIAGDAVISNRILDESITAADLGPNSVGQSEIQTDGVGATEIEDNSIDSGEIVDNTLLSQDLAAGSVRGSELGVITRRSATSGIIPGNGTNNVGVQCLAGERVLAGGNDASSAANVVIVASRNDGANGWRVFARNLAAGNQSVTVHAYCLQAS